LRENEHICFVSTEHGKKVLSVMSVNF